MVRRGADEDESSAGRNRASATAISGVLLAFGQTLADAESGLPRDFAGVAIDRGQTSPRRFLAGPVANDFAAGVLAGSAESGIGSGAGDAGAVIFLRRAFRSSAVVLSIFFL